MLTLRLPGATPRLVQRLLHFYARFARPLTLGVRAVLLDPDRRVFLVRHSYTPGWHCPGGAVEAGETTHEAVIREVREEGAIEILGEPKLHGIFFNRSASRRDHVLVYVVRDFRILGVREPDWEIRETGFFRLDELPEGTTSATRARLREVVEGVAKTELW